MGLRTMSMTARLRLGGVDQAGAWFLFFRIDSIKRGDCQPER